MQWPPCRLDHLALSLGDIRHPHRLALEFSKGRTCIEFIWENCITCIYILIYTPTGELTRWSGYPLMDVYSCVHCFRRVAPLSFADALLRRIAPKELCLWS